MENSTSPAPTHPLNRHRSLMGRPQSSTSKSSSPMRNVGLTRRSRSLSDFPATSISKHYALNHQLLSAHDLFFQQENFQVAYAMGLQFVEMALLEIPKHGYFYSPKQETERTENAADALRVTQQLKQILEASSLTRGQPTVEEVERVDKLAHLAREQVSEKLSVDYEEDRASLEAELKDSGAAFSELFCHSFHNLGEQWSEALCLRGMKRDVGQRDLSPGTATNIPHPRSPETIPFFEGSPSERRPTTSSQRPDAEPERRDSFVLSLQKTSSELDLEKALYLSGLDMDGAAFGAGSGLSEKSPAVSEIDVASLALCYKEDFEQLRQEGLIRVSRLDTYQGRTEGSINGCTVIAPLLCMHHFHNFTSPSDPGLPDSSIRQVIDVETAVVLQDVRDKLGLTKDAFIIPSDVHDFLIDFGMLSQNQFVSVCGGNILDEAHLSSFVTDLTHAAPDRRVAATLFFHEHVVAILRMTRSNGEVWYDFIDSLPYEEMFGVQASFLQGGQPPILDDSERDGPEFPNDPTSELGWGEETIPPYAVRIRCVDKECLKSTLRWYACAKFTEENRKYIDMYNWDDRNTDFDPRVFQAFLWMEAV